MGKGRPRWTRGGQRPRGGSSAPLAAIAALASLVAASGSASAHAAGSAHPDEWTRLIWIMVIMAAGVAAVVYIWMGVALWRYRDSSPYIRREPRVHDTKLESVWTTIPVILVAIIVVLSLQVMQTTEDLPEDGIRIEVIGKQFEWNFVYPDNTTTKDELWVEEGQTVIFEITSTDVIHSFFLPDFYLKVDAIPNSVDEAFIVAEPAGDYDIYCAEFCGDVHSEMLGTLHIYPEGTNDGKAWGPPPGEVPPPPEVERVVLDIELREDGGQNVSRPWSISPANVQVTVDTEVSMRVWNNGTSPHNLSIALPYGVQVGPIPPAQMRFLNFTADKPTSGTVMFCDDEDHWRLGLEARLVVLDKEEGQGVEVAPPTYPWVRSVYALALVIFGGVLVAATRPPKEHAPPDVVHEVGTGDGGTGGEPELVVDEGPDGPPGGDGG